MEKWIALLRGINVGGKNIIPMSKLIKAFETAGMGSVKTYIQSGNVVFEAPKKFNFKNLEKHLCNFLLKELKYSGVVIVLSEKQMSRIIEDAPDCFTEMNKVKFRNDVIFLKYPLNVEKAFEEILNKVKPREGVDFVVKGREVIYFSRLESKASKSRLATLIKTEIYSEVSIRNWNTTSKLAEMILK